MTRRALTQFWSFKIRHATFLNHIKFVGPRILRLLNWGRARWKIHDDNLRSLSDSAVAFRVLAIQCKKNLASTQKIEMPSNLNFVSQSFLTNFSRF